MACEDLVAGCFAGDLAPFGVHPLDEERALEYMICCRKNQMSWAQAAEQITNYLQGKGCTPERIVSDLEMARQKLQPWLD
ncbi:hypothetical protein NLM33_46525 [Bradyrhizobium sp. CCGUVB1N3]|uniref:hypothetical protein n=1 Tax=Bradyrhizobium sp. CCGUVB1N3 TaxID=2949629 RepID=UPI0020B38327|nr:hypothetical protein [Bradyrhizobium sp. CCGUVB1N3]MCP3477614.1 hypothetical protein [Bradyrhizobium sp. CCGUVB1N3]